MQPEFTIQRQRTFTSFAKGVVMVTRSLMGARGSSGGPSFVARTFVGVDVSKSFVDIADTAGRKTRVGNNVAALIGVFT